MLSEVGSKDDTGAITPPYRWVEMMRQELDAGAWKVIAEGREAGTAGIFRPTGEVREGLIGEIVHEIDSRRIMFDAPVKHQQVWFIQRFGPDVNLGNIAPGDVLSLETLRLGLRSDTLGVAATVTAERPHSPDLSGVLLARHGQTNDNLEPIRVQGFTNTPLNDTGRRQAAELGDRLVGAGIRSLYASDLSRARRDRRDRRGPDRAVADARRAAARGQPRRMGGLQVHRRRAG